MATRKKIIRRRISKVYMTLTRSCKRCGTTIDREKYQCRKDAKTGKYYVLFNGNEYEKTIFVKMFSCRKCSRKGLPNYYSKEIIVCVWKDHNALNLPGQGAQRFGHASIRLKDAENPKNNRHISWFPEGSSGIFGKTQEGKKVPTYLDDAAAEMGEKARAGLRFYTRVKLPLIQQKENAYTIIKNAKAKLRAGNLATKETKQLMSYIDKEQAKIAILNEKISHLNHKVYYECEIQDIKSSYKKSIKQKFSEYERTTPIKDIRAKYTKEEFEDYIARRKNAKSYKESIDEEIEYYRHWQKKDKAIDPRHNQKAKLENAGEWEQMTTAADLKIYLPAKGAKRLSDGKMIEHGLDYKKIKEWWDKFSTPDSPEKYKMLSRNKNCSGVVFLALDKGGSKEFAGRPLISSPTTALKYALKLKRIFNKKNDSQAYRIEMPSIKKLLGIGSTVLLKVETILENPLETSASAYLAARKVYELLVMPIATAYKITGSYSVRHNLRSILNSVNREIKKCGNKMTVERLNAIVDKIQHQARKWSRSSGVIKKFGKAILMLTCAKMGRRSKFRLDHITDYLDISAEVNNSMAKINNTFVNAGLRPIFSHSLNHTIATLPLYHFARQNNLSELELEEIQETTEFQGYTTPIKISDILSTMYIKKATGKVGVLKKMDAQLNTICQLINNRISKDTAIKVLFYAIPAMYGKDGKPKGLLNALASKVC